MANQMMAAVSAAAAKASAKAAAAATKAAAVTAAAAKAAPPANAVEPVAVEPVAEGGKKRGKKKGGGSGKGKGVRVRLTDAKGAALTIHRGVRADGTVLVKVLHVAAGSKKTATGMLSVHADDAAAAVKFAEIRTLAEAAGWTVVASAKAVTSTFDALPVAAAA